MLGVSLFIKNIFHLSLFINFDAGSYSLIVYSFLFNVRHWSFDYMDLYLLSLGWFCKFLLKIYQTIVAGSCFKKTRRVTYLEKIFDPEICNLIFLGSYCSITYWYLKPTVKFPCAKRFFRVYAEALFSNLHQPMLDFSVCLRDQF